MLCYAVMHSSYVFHLCWAETCGNTALENIAKQDQNSEIQAYADKLSVIKEVLARRHMKVAFFGRYNYPALYTNNCFDPKKHQ